MIDLQAIWHELYSAIQGIDSGYGALAALLGDEQALTLLNTLELIFN